ncbi:MAG: plasmid pRiA4b ORF-3 family protein, partial [Kineosporiaceae bacterium]
MPKKPKRPRVPSTGGGDSNVIPLHGGAAPEEIRQLIERLNITPDMLPSILSQVGVFGALAKPEPLTVPPPPEEVSTYRIRLDLDDARPPIWRRLELAGDLTLDQVHDVLQAAMGWYDGHLHAFRLNPRDRRHFLTDYDLEEGEEGLAEAGVRLDQVLRSVGDRLVYEYDFGDGWEHTLKVEQIRPRGDDLPARCLGGRRAGPPEDIGGIHWYNGVAAALNGEPGAPELDPELRDWLPSGFDPEAFDADSIDRDLRDLVEDGWGPGGMPVLLAEMLARAGIEATLILDELMTLAARPTGPAGPA